jgi:hypothetical protein
VAAYYYLIASLPMLKFNDSPPISRDKFLTEAQKEVAQHPFAQLCSLFSDERAIDHPYLKEWDTFNEEVNSLLAHLRSQRLNFTHKEEVKRDPKLEAKLREIVQNPNPLEAETQLMQLYWERATELSRMKVFTIEVLFTYAIQLNILERKALFTQEAGNREFNQLFTTLQSIIKSI